MKPLITTTVVLAFSLYMAPAMAFDNGGSVKGPVSFPAFSHMSALECTTLTPLTDTELASVEGATLAGLTAARETISLALLKAQTGTLGCDTSCVAQIMTRLTLSPTGAPPLVVQQMSPQNGVANNAVMQRMSLPNKSNIAVVKQVSPPNGGTNNAIVQQSIR